MSAASQASRFPRRFSIVFSVLFLIAYWPGVVFLPYNGVFNHAEDAWHDKLFQLFSAKLPSGDPRIIIAAIDDDTGKKFGFPLPRAAHAKVIDALRALGAKAISFDVMFIEPREGDAELAAATKRFGRVIHLYHFETKYTAVGQIVDVIQPIEPLRKTAWALAYPNVDRVVDSDGHVRRAILFDGSANDPQHPDSPAQSLDVASYRGLTDDAVADVQRRWATPIDHELILNFRAPQRWLRHPILKERAGGKPAQFDQLSEVESPYRHISLSDILAGTLTAEQRAAIKGALLFVGSSSTGYYDHFPSPFNPQALGVEFHCNVVDNMLHDDFVKTLSSFWFVLAILAMIWLPMGLLSLSPLAGALVTLGVMFVWWGIGFFGFSNRVYIEFMAPTFALVTSFLAQTVHRVLLEGQEKKRIKGLFSQYVAPEVVNDLAQNPEKAKIGAETRDMTMFFLDIAHFTTISEKMSADALIAFLNRYLTGFSDIVMARKGVVGNYIGDCVMAFWNAPILPVPDHHAQACLAALECQEELKRLNQNLEAGLPERPAIRIGLNSGSVKVGNSGSAKRLQYTVLGDEVNLSSRLEGANKFFGSSIMVSEATYVHAKDSVEARELGRVRVVGKETPIRVFEVLGKKGALSADWTAALSAYNRGLTHFIKRQYDEAVLAFQEVVKLFPDDGPANLYLNAARDYAAIPPEENWDGVFNLTAK